MKFSGLTIAVPREIMDHEFRVAATPETVRRFTDQGATVLVESGAGAGSHFSDDDYRGAGAEIIQDAETLFSRADIILKVKEPILNTATNRHEASLLKGGQILVSFLHPASPVNHDMVRALAKRGVTALTLDGIPRITRAQPMDALTSMSTVAGYKGMVLAASHLSRFIPMITCAAGTIQPASVLVVGVGVCDLQALATAKRLGAVAHACDIRRDAAEQAKSLGAKIVETGVPPEIATGDGGYAAHLSDEWLAKEREAITPAVIQSDIIVLSALVPGRIAPVLVTEEMVKSMKPGSVIVDISIDQGGNCALTDFGEISVKHGVTIIGIKNIPGSVPASSTWMFANNVYHFVSSFIDGGRVSLDRNDEIIASSLVTIGGELVHRGAIEAMALTGAKE